MDGFWKSQFRFPCEADTQAQFRNWCPLTHTCPRQLSDFDFPYLVAAPEILHLYSKVQWCNDEINGRSLQEAKETRARLKLLVQNEVEETLMMSEGQRREVH